jgi:hypothetical protein
MLVVIYYFFIILRNVAAFMSAFLVFCIGASECCLGVCLFEQVRELPDLGAVISEGDPYFALAVYVRVTVDYMNK